MRCRAPEQAAVYDGGSDCKAGRQDTHGVSNVSSILSLCKALTSSKKPGRLLVAMRQVYSDRPPCSICRYTFAARYECSPSQLGWLALYASRARRNVGSRTSPLAEGTFDLPESRTMLRHTRGLLSPSTSLDMRTQSIVWWKTSQRDLPDTRPSITD